MTGTRDEDPSPLAWPPELDVRYRLVEVLGSGAMGSVVLAEDRELGRQVAIKMVLDPRDASLAERLVREARILSRVRHPHVVQVLDSGTTGRGPYVVMERIEGRSLERPVPGLDPLAVMEQVGQGLGACHRAGVLHRDLKPSNVMVDREGRARLVDFGLAMSEDLEPMTRTGAVVGTLGFLAPERIAGSPASAESDWFAWGCSLYMLLEGRPPFEVGTLFGLAAGQVLPRPEFTRVTPGSQVAKVIETALAHRPGDRHQALAALEAHRKAMLPASRGLEIANPVPPSAPDRGEKVGSAPVPGPADPEPRRNPGPWRFLILPALALAVLASRQGSGRSEPGSTGSTGPAGPRLQRVVLEPFPEPRIGIVMDGPWNGGLLGQAEVAAPAGVGFLAFEPSRLAGRSLVAASPGGVPEPVAAFPDLLAESIAAELETVDGQELAADLLVQVGSDGIPPVPATIDAVQQILSDGFLRSDRGLPLPLLCRAAGDLARDPRLSPELARRLARRLAGLAVVDATLEALGVGPGDRADELTSGLGALFPETTREPEGPGTCWSFPSNDNGLLPVGVANPGAYQARIRFLTPDEEPAQLERVVTLGKPGTPAPGRIRLRMRATHPESVIQVEIDGAVQVPIRWHASHGAMRGLKGLDRLTSSSRQDTDSVARMLTRDFLLPPGWVSAGAHTVRIWCDNARSDPDAWVPSLDEVCLLP